MTGKTANPYNNKIFIISGPSGVGKTAVIKLILKQIDLGTGVTYTTKSKYRPADDKIMHYISKTKFKQMIKQRQLAEYALLHETYYYGTSKKHLIKTLQKKSALLNIDVQGAWQIKKQFPKNTVLIFIAAESLAVLIDRITRSKKNEPNFAERVKTIKKELKLSKKYDYLVVNKEGQLKETAKKIIEIIKLEN